MILFRCIYARGGIKMAVYGKAILSLIEVILFILGIFPIDTNISYGGNDYVAPAIITLHPQ